MPTAAQLSRLAQVSKAAAKNVRERQGNTKVCILLGIRSSFPFTLHASTEETDVYRYMQAVTLRTYEFVVYNESGALKPKDETALKRFPRWKELNLVVRGAGQDPKERFFATDVHFKQRSSLKVAGHCS